VINRSPPTEPYAGGMHTYDVVLRSAPKWIICDFANTASVRCSPRHVTSHLGLGGPEPCSLP